MQCTCIYMALQAYIGVHVAVAYTCTVHILLSFKLSRHFTELEQVGHNLIMTISGSVQERSLKSVIQSNSSEIRIVNDLKLAISK